MTVADIARDTVRGQYSRGRDRRRAGQGLSGRRKRAGRTAARKPSSRMRAHINNWRWANVPFFLRTGKRLQKKQSEIVIEFADLPFSIIPSGPRNYGNRLVIQLQPEESIQLQMLAKEPGSGMHMLPVNLNLDLAAGLHRASRGSVRAAADRRDARAPHALHAPRRTRSGMGVGRADPGWLEGTRTTVRALIRRARSDRRHRRR